MRNHRSSTAVALSAAALTLGLAGPASAATYAVEDPRDTEHGSDLLAVEVDFAEDDLFITTTHENLRRSWTSGSVGRIFLDTDQENWGPEYVFVGGFYEGTDYFLLEADGFAPSKWGVAIDASYEMTIHYRADEVQLRISADALDEATGVSLGMRVSGTRSDGTSNGLVDWLGDRRVMTPWVARG